MHENNIQNINTCIGDESVKSVNRVRREGKGLIQISEEVLSNVENEQKPNGANVAVGHADKNNVIDVHNLSDDEPNKDTEFMPIDVVGTDDLTCDQGQSRNTKQETNQDSNKDEIEGGECHSNRNVENWPKVDVSLNRNKTEKKIDLKGIGGNNMENSKAMGDEGMVGGGQTPTQRPSIISPKNDGFVLQPQKGDGFVGRRFTPIDGAVFNRCTIRQLRCVRNGRVSSMTNLATYLYQLPLVSVQSQSLINVLNEVINGEIRHINQLGRAIVSFGGSAKFLGGQGTPWSTRFITYQTNPALFIGDNIRMIQRYIREIERVRSRQTNQSLVTLLGEIIAEEQAYINLFSNI